MTLDSAASLHFKPAPSIILGKLKATDVPLPRIETPQRLNRMTELRVLLNSLPRFEEKLAGMRKIVETIPDQDKGYFAAGLVDSTMDYFLKMGEEEIMSNQLVNGLFLESVVKTGISLHKGAVQEAAARKILEPRSNLEFKLANSVISVPIWPLRTC